MTNSNYYTFTRNDIIPFLDESLNSVLDVGCATGQFGNYLKENIANEVWGVEPVKHAYMEANKNLDHVIHGVFDKSIKLPLKHFDAIFLTMFLNTWKIPGHP